MDKTLSVQCARNFIDEFVKDTNSISLPFLHHIQFCHHRVPPVPIGDPIENCGQHFKAGYLRNYYFTEDIFPQTAHLF